MKTIALLSILFLAPFMVKADEPDEAPKPLLSLQILVIDGATDEPIPAAKVKFGDILTETYTDLDGLVTFDNISEGAYEFEVSFISYEKFVAKAIKIDQSSSQILVKLYP